MEQFVASSYRNVHWRKFKWLLEKYDRSLQIPLQSRYGGIIEEDYDDAGCTAEDSTDDSITEKK